MEPLTLGLLVTCAFIAGIFDATVGGGGFILIPFLAFTGLTIQLAIGTSRLIFLMDSFSALVGHAGKKNIDCKTALTYVVASVFGAQLGAYATSHLPNGTMSLLFGLFMLSMLFLIIFNKNFGITDKRRMKRQIFNIPTGFFVGFLIGMFGGGVGIVIIILLVFVSGLTMLHASGTSQLVVFVTNISAIFAYWSYDLIDFKLGFVLGVAAMLGAQAGVVVAHKVGNEWLRRILILVTVVSALKLIF